MTPNPDKAEDPEALTQPIEIPDRGVAAAYERAAGKNVLAALNPEIFPGYWSVCADGLGHGFGNTYPSLDGHQMSDALLFLGQAGAVKANWDYVRKFQRADGQLPLAILPSEAGKLIGPPSDSMLLEAKAELYSSPEKPTPTSARVDPNGGLYAHWVPGDPLRALAGVTYIQNADAIFRQTQDLQWLAEQLPSVNLAADHLAALTGPDGIVRGAGYYVERPTRIESDGVTQCHAVDAFRCLAALNRVAGDGAKAARYEELADQIRQQFVTRFWAGDHFAEYLHPERGLVASHGLTDVDWAAIATGVATPDQQAILWPQLKDDDGFYYGGMPTGIATRPETYEDWEFSHPSRHDLAAMGRVWYLEAWARARMGDAAGLLDGLRRVSQAGRKGGYHWGERYQPDGNVAGPTTYCEYPANLIRIVQRFLFGVDYLLDGSVVLSPTAPSEFWERGFGQTITWRNRSLHYRMRGGRIEGTYSGAEGQILGVKLPLPAGEFSAHAVVEGHPAETRCSQGLVFITLPFTPDSRAVPFDISLSNCTKQPPKIQP